VQDSRCPTGRQPADAGSRLRRSRRQMGQPFVIGRDGSRDEVIAKYRAWIVQQPALMAALHELRGKNLVCARALPRRRAHRTREPVNFRSRRDIERGCGVTRHPLRL
jgi:hypothetical protein